MDCVYAACPTSGNFCRRLTVQILRHYHAIISQYFISHHFLLWLHSGQSHKFLFVAAKGCKASPLCLLFFGFDWVFLSIHFFYFPRTDVHKMRQKLGGGGFFGWAWQLNLWPQIDCKCITQTGEFPTVSV